MSIKIASLTIIYNASSSITQNISSYAKSVDKVFIYDNSEKTNDVYLKELKNIPNIEYIKSNDNEGLSIPINKIAAKALQEGFQWLITFDQDSFAYEDMLSKMKTFAKNYKKNDLGIIAPTIKNELLSFAINGSTYTYFDKVFQSGAMHNLEIFAKINGYNEELFIDQVDYEFCIRLREYGYKIIKLNNAILLHNTDDTNIQLKYINGKKFYINKYSPYRYYYIIRNNLYCIKKYKKKEPIYALECKRNIINMKELVKIDTEPFRKKKAIFRGYIDFYLHRMKKCTKLL